MIDFHDEPGRRPPPRCAFTTTWTPDELRVEKGLSRDTLDLLQAKGHRIVVKPVMGRTQTIQVRDGLLYGASDPRNPDGRTLGY